MEFDASLAVARALTDKERRAFKEAWVRLNPRWRGAGVADILAELANADALLRITEPLYEEHGADVFEPGLIAAAAYAVVYINWPAPGVTTPPAAPWKDVLALVDRVRPKAQVHRIEVSVRVNPYAMAEWNAPVNRPGPPFDPEPSNWDWDELVRAVVGEGVAIADITDYSTDANAEGDRLDRALARGEV